MRACVCVCVHALLGATVHMWKPEDNLQDGSPSIMWAPEMELGFQAWQQVPLITKPSHKSNSTFSAMLEEVHSVALESILY